jgi:UDP-galactopyranose mutase
MKCDALVVGAGFAGSVVAERLASAGKSVLVVDQRSHIGGNAYDEFDHAGVLVHRYGPHIFHTNAPNVVEYLSMFTEWRPYEHRVLSSVRGALYPVPINRTTINTLYGLSLDEVGIAAFLEKVRERRDPVRTSEDVVLNSVGSDLCDKFFRNYTRKQWGMDLSELSASVAARIPVRTNSDDRYFDDQFQKMPAEGYLKMFHRMLGGKNIRVELGTTYEQIRQHVKAGMVFYSGPIDEYFGFSCGKLPYRSLHFEHEHLSEIEKFQSVATVNYPNDFDFTRITEFKHMTGQSHTGTSIVREYPQSTGEPYYPVPTAENYEIYRRYNAMAGSERNLFFVGRLAKYRYYNMDQVIAAALRCAGKVLGETSQAISPVI